ncbi:glycosyltransferase family 2 protein [Sulfuricurvum sp.]|uniref:glycosyltransferase family 2 protein n=1 Tax=Sulfuricurvum sp. TaxID=2025608 RepID=UPI002617D84D|nr:glycosyltransferase family 2 protein [Sulfuricurvum sp.]MDD3597005.1 glycosyltransferase family 2 protein [Sulfuricurvum sp.]
MDNNGINSATNSIKAKTKNRFDTEKPLISIITVVYNGEKHLEETIRSVINQTYDNIEYIVIDGGSTDRTVDIIQKYDHAIKYWISEKDYGISDAFNKGIAKASENSYIQLLNAGDTLISSTVLSELVPHLDSSIVSFKTLSKSGRFIGLDTYRTQEDFTRLPHQSTFVKKEVYTLFGTYSLGYKIRMDYEFFSRIVPFIVPKIEPIIAVVFDSTGISSSLKHKFRFEAEGVIIEFLYFNRSIFRVLYLPVWRTFKSTIATLLRILGLRR